MCPQNLVLMSTHLSYTCVPKSTSLCLPISHTHVFPKPRLAVCPSLAHMCPQNLASLSVHPSHTCVPKTSPHCLSISRTHLSSKPRLTVCPSLAHMCPQNLASLSVHLSHTSVFKTSPHCLPISRTHLSPKTRLTVCPSLAHMCPQNLASLSVHLSHTSVSKTSPHCLSISRIHLSSKPRLTVCASLAIPHTVCPSLAHMCPQNLTRTHVSPKHHCLPIFRTHVSPKPHYPPISRQDNGTLAIHISFKPAGVIFAFVPFFSFLVFDIWLIFFRLFVCTDNSGLQIQTLTLDYRIGHFRTVGVVSKSLRLPDATSKIRPR